MPQMTREREAGKPPGLFATAHDETGTSSS